MKKAEYAAYRGVSGDAVTKYQHEGRLVEVDGMVDVDATDAVLAETLNPIHGGNRRGKRSPSGNISYLEAKTDEARARATKATLETELLAGTLVRLDEVKAEAFALARAAREALMAIPDRLAPLLAAETDPAKIHGVLADEIRRVCQALGDAGPA